MKHKQTYATYWQALKLKTLFLADDELLLFFQTLLQVAKNLFSHLGEYLSFRIRLHEH